MITTEIKPLMSGVRPQELKSRLDQGVHLEVIDVRTPAEYRHLHLRGSILMPLDALNPRDVLAMRRDPAGAPIYLLCRTGKRAALAAEKFAMAGFREAIVIEGGILACQSAGWPVERGPTHISLERQIRIAAGSLVVVGVLLGFFLHPAFYAMAALVGAGLVFAGITDTCGMGMLLAKMPWNGNADASAKKAKVSTIAT
jgi:rhodanese-related sulfurtransferase